jgi:FKBP-type peptidyl-prolyl cis-trans isomerase (trigger factor)
VAEVIRNAEKAYGKPILDDSIRKILFNQELRKNNINVSEEDIQGEMNKLEESLKKQGQTLDGALEEQKISRAELRERIVLRKGIEKLLGDKVPFLT